MLEHAVTQYDAAFVLKTDDDAYINVPAMTAQLRALCEHPGCVGERIYMGKMARHSEVLLQPGHKWNNAAFYNHTGASWVGAGGCMWGGAGPAGVGSALARRRRCRIGRCLPQSPPPPVPTAGAATRHRC